MLDLHELLKLTVEHRGSDLHIKVGSPPHVRVDGRLMATSLPSVLPADSERMALAMLSKDRAESFMATGEADVAYSVPGLGRFRVNAFRQRGSIGLVLRRVLPGVASCESLGLPGVVPRLAEETKGLVLVTGPTGSGRTTTLAALVDHINATRAVHIVTIEDPIEVLHTDKLALVNQRELGTDTSDYAEALRRAQRQDPDVIVVGEIGDQATAAATLAAAESGHLVLSTMKTGTATETINRLIEFFPPFEQARVRQSVATTLKGIISQQLLERTDGRGRVPAVEVLIMTSRVFDRVLEPAGPETIEDVLSEGEYYGMQTLDQSLFGLFKNGSISLRDAMSSAVHPTAFKLSLQVAGLASET